jgi:p-cumate 2,3-dioxygenase ferredoxin reductase subunit
VASATDSIVIAGAGQAGGRAAEALRAGGFRGEITMIGAEPHPPYERPQLSKAMLAGPDIPATFMRPAADWSGALGVNLVTGSRIVHCDASRRRVATEDGRSFAYGRLLIATGTRPRRLAALENAPIEVQYLRSIEDALKFRGRLSQRVRIAIVGGGVIGLEAACAAARQGCSVTVIENEPQLLARAFPAIVSDLVAARHRSHGVTFIFSATVTAANATGVVLSNGETVACDLVLVGIGVEPIAGIARQIGLSGEGGIRVDDCGRTEAEGVFCAGDAALQWSRCHDRAIRVETWANAQNQAISVARNMAGDESPYRDPPWFWTDQYDLNIQVVGDLQNADHVLRDSPGNGRFSVIALRDGEMVGAVSVNAAKEMAMLRKLISAQAKPHPADLESAAYNLRAALS